MEICFLENNLQTRSDVSSYGSSLKLRESLFLKFLQNVYETNQNHQLIMFIDLKLNLKNNQSGM